MLSPDSDGHVLVVIGDDSPPRLGLLAGPVSVGSVYTMRMARVNVYLPDDLARQARAAGMSVSNVTQVALRRELGARNTSEWLSRLARLPALKVAHEQVISAIDSEREEFGHHDG